MMRQGWENNKEVYVIEVEDKRVHPTVASNFPLSRCPQNRGFAETFHEDSKKRLRDCFDLFLVGGPLLFLAGSMSRQAALNTTYPACPCASSEYLCEDLSKKTQDASTKGLMQLHMKKRAKLKIKKGKGQNKGKDFCFSSIMAGLEASLTAHQLKHNIVMKPSYLFCKESTKHDSSANGDAMVE
eukprot:Gb_28545 [translate_table: standard]